VSSACGGGSGWKGLADGAGEGEGAVIFTGEGAAAASALPPRPLPGSTGGQGCVGVGAPANEPSGGTGLVPSGCFLAGGDLASLEGRPLSWFAAMMGPANTDEGGSPAKAGSSDGPAALEDCWLAEVGVGAFLPLHMSQKDPPRLAKVHIEHVHSCFLLLERLNFLRFILGSAGRESISG